jgi:predicted nucleic acid-binding protein
VNDLIIAATCVSLGFSLATLDRQDNGLIEGLDIAGFWTFRPHFVETME